MAKREVTPKKDKKEIEDPIEENNSLIKRKFPNIDKYKAKVEKKVEYKPQEWIDMSHAFKEVTRLPGIPVGHISMVYGKSDTGKTTMLVEAGAYAQRQGILPVCIITENKFSWDRAKTMGLDPDACIVHNGIETIEEGMLIVRNTLREQASGELPYDVVFLWDSIGGTASNAENEANEEEDGAGGRAMMETAKILRAKVARFLGPKINATRKAEYPYNATWFIVNHAYSAPPKPPSRIGTIEPYGGDGIWLPATLVFRMGGVMGRSSKVSAEKNKVTVAFALKTALVLEKNHITDVSAKGRIICTDHGFILDDKSSIDEYKKKYRDDWDLNYDDYWNSVSDD